ncbi:MAG: endonuclease [Bacilli bacterium]|nr:endonuclease [Bacilli bacterium]MDD4077328.1 endonuclease [Bacilli bacterium]MDD4389040.1 endonuclease [Bacilli bacterium]
MTKKIKIKRISGLISLFVIIIIALSGCDFFYDLIDFFDNNDQYTLLPLEEYYKEAEGLDGDQLSDFLTELIGSNVKGLSYAEAKSALAEADCDPNDPTKVITIYSRDRVNAKWDSTSWHREHVWPNSRLGVRRVGESEINQASDLHNLRAIVPRVNSSRGNKVFSNETAADTYYPGDEDKGDVARILFYMVIRYPELSLVNEVLPNDPETNYTPEGAKMAVLSCLLMWHQEDPPDDFERKRNEVIYKWQNNRNPFIDHPEFVAMIFGD